MEFRITKEYVWAGPIPDRPDALAEKLRSLHASGINLEMILARKDWSGTGMLFFSPLRTVEEIEAAERAGLSMSDSFQVLRVEGPNRPGVAARITTALSHANLNLRGYSAAALGETHVTTIAFDRKDDVDRGKAVLEEALAKA